MNVLLKHSARLIFFVLIQALILNQVELGLGTLIMIYPLFILLLPVDLSIFILLILAFVVGISIDILANTYGLHASSLLMMAYFRPIVLKAFSPRDGYDLEQETSIYSMGFLWFFKTFGLLLLIHHFWFFLIELFRFDEIIYVLWVTILSVPLSFTLCLLIQFLFIRKPRKDA